MQPKIIFITGNEDKFREFKEILTAVKLNRRKIDLPELQGTPEEIVKEKARLACQKIKQPCFVDDTSLCFDDWGGLPGPYIKDFLRYMGNKKLAELLLTQKNHRARAIASIGFCEPGKKPICLQGITTGKIVRPQGHKNFKKGIDQIFVPDGDQRTYAQMNPDEKYSYSQRKKAILAFEKYLKNKYKE